MIEPFDKLRAQSARKQAFTLIELLVVIAVIAILAALLFPAISSANRMAVQTGCLARLRPVGIALQGYANDHNDMLPGPLWAGARANYDQGTRMELIYHIATYLDEPAPSTRMVTPKKFVCPAYNKFAKGLLEGRKIWLLSGDIDPDQSNTLLPFGYPTGPNASKPMALSLVDEFVPGTSLYAVTDVDQAFPRLDPSVAWFTELPPEPLHGPSRNQLFFDWHVESVPW